MLYTTQAPPYDYEILAKKLMGATNQTKKRGGLCLICLSHFGMFIF